MAAKAVYDDQDQRHKNPAEYDPDRVPGAEELEQRTGIDGAEVLERAENDTKEAKPKKIRERDQDSDEEEEQALNEKLDSAWSQAKKQDKSAGSGDGLYKASTDSDDGFIDRMRKNRKALAGVGAGAAILLVIIGMLFSFLNIFKLNHILSNVDVKSFSRLNAATDRRSDRWVRAYIEIRLAKLNGPGTDPDSEFFRSKRVDTNNPIRDWYHTLRLSSFERDLAKKGIVFANRDDGPGGLKYSVLFINGDQVAGLSAKDLRQGKLVDIINNPTGNNLDILHKLDINLSKPGGNKEARATIALIVDQNTQRHQVFKRYAMRKAMQNVMGVRSWRFFEKTRDKIDNKQVVMRNKIVKKVIPNTTKSGALIYCLLGIDNCQHDGDTGNTKENGVHTGDTSSDSEPDTPNPDNAPDKTSKEIARKIMVKIGIFGAALKITSALTMIANVDHNISTGELSTMVEQARGTQAAALYQTFATAKDHQINGTNVTGDEVNQLMQVVNTSANSEGWTKVVNGQGDPKQLTNTTASREYCSSKHQEFISKPENIASANKEYAYLCPDKQIGGPTNASNLEQAYTSSVGYVLHPIAVSWQAAKDTKIGGVLIDIATALGDWASKILGGAVRIALDAVGLGSSVDDVVNWAATHMLSFLGAGPIINGTEPGGVFGNWMIQGAAYTAESSSRQMGAALSTVLTQKTNDSMMAEYYQNKNQQMGSYDKYVSLDNPKSLGSKWAFALSNINTNSLSSALSGVSNGFFGVFSNLTGKARAAGDDSRASANFAGIEMYDFPAKCTDSDPLNISKPSDVSNIGAVLGPQAAADLDAAGWDVAGDTVAWYDFLYAHIPDGKVDKKVYNCAIFDRSIRGSLGRVYGYTNDGGLEDGGGTPAASNPTTPGSGTNPPASVAGYRNPLRAIMANHSLAPLRVDEGVDYGGHGPIYAIGPGVVVATTIHSSFWNCCGGESTVYKLTAGPAAGKSVFFAESCTPAVKPGDIVDSNTVICNMHGDNSPWTESGWALGDGTDTPAAFSVYHNSPDGIATAYGVNFSDLMKSLGAPPGNRARSTNPPTVVGTLPVGWPTW